MRVQLVTTAMVLRLATRSFGFSPASSGGIAAQVSSRHAAVAARSHGRHPRPSAAAPFTSAPSPAAARPTGSRTPKTARKMVLRPDWEREGRVYGLRMPRERTAERAFEYLVDYPCEFEIKVIGINEGSFADDIAATVSAVCEVETSDVRFTVRDTTSGRYQSITVHAPVKNATMLYKCYELIDEDPRVKFKF
ncbi:unnamed protein product [Ectocarpus fasciculatus]